VSPSKASLPSFYCDRRNDQDQPGHCRFDQRANGEMGRVERQTGDRYGHFWKKYRQQRALYWQQCWSAAWDLRFWEPEVVTSSMDSRRDILFSLRATNILWYSPMQSKSCDEKRKFLLLESITPHSLLFALSHALHKSLNPPNQPPTNRALHPLLFNLLNPILRRPKRRSIL
jgi:hypothetical protein